jgi:hypothetical protein
MMKTILKPQSRTIKTTFFLTVLNTSIFAQAPAILWTKTLGNESLHDTGNSVQQTSDNGYIITGTKDSDVWLIKTDSSGDTLWTNTFEYGEGNSVQQTSDGGYIIAGAGGYSPNSPDVWLIKTDANGDTMWTKTFGDSLWDYGNSVQQTSDSGYIITGSRSKSFSGSSGDVWLIKTDANGDTIWTKTFGNNLDHTGNSVQQTSDDGYIIAGTYNVFRSVYSLPSDVWLIKTDSNGDTIWTKIIRGSDELGYQSSTDVGKSVQQTSDDGYIIIGCKDDDIWLIKTDSEGDTLWTKTYDSGKNDWGNSIQQTSDGGYIIAGNKDSDIWLLKTDTNGDTTWTKILDGGYYDWSNSVQKTSDGGYIITGVAKTSGDFSDVWLIKTAPEITSIDENPHAVISGFQLHQNYPNPFNPTTKISFTIPKPEHFILNVYNTLGQKVATLLDQKMNAGSHDVTFDAPTLPSGIYFYRIQAGEFSQVRKMVLLR